jgi:hypothetical protein
MPTKGIKIPTLDDMVYRYDSDEDAYVPYRDDETEGSSPQPGPPPPAGPSPSRFPTPSLARPNQIMLPSSAPPAGALAATQQELAPRYDLVPPTPEEPTPDGVGGGTPESGEKKNRAAGAGHDDRRAAAPPR